MGGSGAQRRRDAGGVNGGAWHQQRAWHEQGAWHEQRAWHEQEAGHERGAWHERGARHEQGTDLTALLARIDSVAEAPL